MGCRWSDVYVRNGKRKYVGGKRKGKRRRYGDEVLRNARRICDEVTKNRLRYFFLSCRNEAAFRESRLGEIGRPPFPEEEFFPISIDAD